MAFGLDFFTVAPGLRLAGDSLAFAYKFTGKGGELKDLDGLEIGLVDDPAVKLLEGSVSGYEQVADRDAVYSALVAGGLTEIVPGLALGVDSLSSIETGDKAIRLAVAGSQPVLVFRNANVQEVTKVGDGGYTWDLPAGTFATLKAAAEVYVSDLKTKVDQMIADRISADGVLQAAVDAQATSDATARAAIIADLATEASTRETNDNTIIASVANEASTRESADTALSDRLDVLEADPTTATAVAASDTATLSSANTYTDTAVSNEATTRGNADNVLSGRLDVLEADPTTATAVAAVQADVDQNESDADAAIAGEATTRANADTALSGRLDVLEADPTTAAAVAAVQADVDQNESDSDAALALKAPLADPDFTGQLEVDVNLRLEYDSNLTKIHNILRGTSIEIGNNIQMKPAAAGGRVEIAGGLQVDITEVPEYSNDTQAAAGGIIVGGIYRSGSVVHIRVS
jgi:hypothetical protein